MNVFFDIDYTIFGGMDGSLRPGTLEVFEELVGLGHNLYIWSGVGVRWDEVRRAGLEPFVQDVYRKPLPGREVPWLPHTDSLHLYGVPVVPDFVIDDYPEIVLHFGGYRIKDYVYENPNDEEMYTIRARIDSHQAMFATRTSVEEAGS
jgi:hypothetical protein